MSTLQTPVFTIGHSTQAIDAFVELLRKHGVTAVADVRSAPYSRFNPQFNKEALERSLDTVGIKYVFLGRELGARSDDRSCYENGRVQYARLARTQLFDQGIRRIVRGSEEHRIALLCAEKEPLECHRTLLVARALDERGIEVAHILGNGRLEAHRDAMERLLDVTGLPREDLFRSREELIALALARQEEKVAYVDERSAPEAAGEAQ
ncbi:MAG TPA: DUF488 domain-containing protein [Terrimesophilobacter sp.]|nr:DUF488 domain-containing protein [Terrimesophilobacter sp.]